MPIHGAAGQQQNLSMYSMPLMMLYVTNLCYALPKRTLPASFPFMKENLGLTNKDYGDISAGFSLGYGLFKLIGGVMTDFVSANVLFSCGLLAASLLNCVFPHVVAMMIDNGSSDGSISLLGLIWVFWTINGILQGVGGPALSKVVIQSVNAQERSLIWSNLHSANNIGYLISPYLLLFPIKFFGWKGPFWFVGLFGFFVSICSVWMPVESHSCTNTNRLQSNMSTDDSNSTKLPDTSAKTELPKATIKSIKLAVAVICLIFSNALTYFILKTISDWQVLYTMEVQSFPYELSITLTFWTEIGAIAGTFLAASLTEKFGFSKTFTCAICSTFALMCFAFQWILSENLELKGTVVHKGLIFVVTLGASVGLNCPKAMLFLQATEKSLELLSTCSQLHSHQYAGTISGVIGLFAQVGASCSGNIVGAALSKSGWHCYIPFQLAGTASLVILLAMACILENIPHLKDKHE